MEPTFFSAKKVLEEGLRTKRSSSGQKEAKRTQIQRLCAAKKSRQTDEVLNINNLITNNIIY